MNSEMYDKLSQAWIDYEQIHLGDSESLIGEVDNILTTPLTNLLPTTQNITGSEIVEYAESVEHANEFAGLVMAVAGI